MLDIVKNYPNALICGNSDGQWFYPLHAVYANGDVRYDMNNGGTSYIIFDKDGNYKSHNDNYTLSCHGDSLSLLAEAKRTINFLKPYSKSQDQDITMAEGLPDALICGNKSGQWFYPLHAVYDNGDVRYDMNSGGHYYITFSSDGEYKTHNTGHTQSCAGESLDTLSNLGMTFSIVTSRVQGEDSIISGFPDILRCGVSGSDWFYPLHAAYDNGDVRYDMNYGGGYYIIFSSDGEYKTSNSNHPSTCKYSSIAELYNDGRAYNTVNKEIPVFNILKYSNMQNEVVQKNCVIKSFEDTDIKLTATINNTHSKVTLKEVPFDSCKTVSLVLEEGFSELSREEFSETTSRSVGWSTKGGVSSTLKFESGSFFGGSSFEFSITKFYETVASRDHSMTEGSLKGTQEENSKIKVVADEIKICGSGTIEVPANECVVYERQVVFKLYKGECESEVHFSAEKDGNPVTGGELQQLYDALYDNEGYLSSTNAEIIHFVDSEISIPNYDVEHNTNMYDCSQ
jgi:hypothetical protein